MKKDNENDEMNGAEVKIICRMENSNSEKLIEIKNTLKKLRKNELNDRVKGSGGGKKWAKTGKVQENKRKLSENAS